MVNLQRSREESERSDASGRRADGSATAALTAPRESLSFLAEATTLERDGQVRHGETSRLHEAYARRLLGDERAGPALVLAIGDVVGELGLALHVIGSDGATRGGRGLARRRPRVPRGRAPLR